MRWLYQPSRRVCLFQTWCFLLHALTEGTISAITDHALVSNYASVSYREQSSLSRNGRQNSVVSLSPAIAGADAGFLGSDHRLLTFATARIRNEQTVTLPCHPLSARAFMSLARSLETLCFQQ